MDVVAFLEVANEAAPPSSGKPRVPWRSQPDDDTFITLPVFMAFCGIASALRPRNRKNARFRAILCLQEETCLSVYRDAARAFLHGVADYKADTRPFVSDWGGRYSHRDQLEVLQAEGRPKTRSDYLNAIAVCVGGLAAELEQFGTFAEGASGFETADLNLATELATALEGGRGMGHTLIVEDLQSERLTALRVHNSEFRRRVHDVLDCELSRARSIINANRAAVDEIVGRLMETKVMTGDEVVEIVKRHRRPTVSLAKVPRSGMGA